MHLAGKKHQKKLKQILLASLVTPSAIVISQEGNYVSCELCGINCTSYEVLKTHISGKKHKKDLEKSEKPIGPHPVVPAIEPVTEPVTEPAPEVTMLVIGTQKQDSPKEEGKIVNVSGSKKKSKIGGNHEDVETKKQEILEGGGMVDAMRTCTMCKVVCSRFPSYVSHVLRSKHASYGFETSGSSSSSNR